MIRVRTAWLALCVVLSMAALADEQPTVDDLVAAGKAKIERDAAAGAGAASETAKTALPDPPDAVAMADPTTRAKYLAALQRYYDYRHNGYEFRSRVFEWQLMSSRVIFVIVVLLVLAGIYFAAVQFHVALAAARRPAPPVPATDDKNAAGAPQLSLATQLEISAKGVVVNSSVLGVIVLALSLAFFYLYLVYVYPIRDTL